MKLHIITIGQPKLAYAKQGWSEYLSRLKHYHSLKLTHIPDKYNDAEHILAAAAKAYKVALVIEGQQLTSTELANFLDKRATDAREVCFMIGGPEGLPQAVLTNADWQWSLSCLTFPHDLAMIILVEALYRASTITSGQPYHK